MATVQSIIDRATFILKDYDRVRWTSEELLSWVNDAQSQIAKLITREIAKNYTITLAEGSRQDLAALEPNSRWMRIYDILCNAPGGKPTGATIRQIDRSALDHAFRTWRGKPPTSAVVEEFALDERQRTQFDVWPPVAAGARVFILAAKQPSPVTASSTFGLPDTYDIPAVDYVLWRAFSKDANDPTYIARRDAHMQAFELAMRAEMKDAAQQ